MADRLHVLQHQNRLSKLKIDRLKDKVAGIIEKQSEAFDQETSDDLKQMMMEEEEHASKTFAEGSFKQVFWQQQKDAAMKPDKGGIRWHPLFIKWCLYL